MEEDKLQGVICHHENCGENAVAICEDHNCPICDDCLVKLHFTCNVNLKKRHLKVLFHVTRTIKWNIKKINDLDFKINHVFSQNLPDMKKYFEFVKIRVNEIEENKNENEDEVKYNFNNPKEKDEKLKRLLYESTIQADFFKQLFKNQNEIISRLDKFDKDRKNERKKSEQEKEEQKRRMETEQKGWLRKLFWCDYPDEQNTELQLDLKGRKKVKNRNVQKGEYCEDFDSEQSSDSSHDHNEILSDTLEELNEIKKNQDLKKIKEEVDTKKSENYKITN